MWIVVWVWFAWFGSENSFLKRCILSLHPWLMLSAFASTELSWVLLAGSNRLAYFSINIAICSLFLFVYFVSLNPQLSLLGEIFW